MKQTDIKFCKDCKNFLIIERCGAYREIITIDKITGKQINERVHRIHDEPNEEVTKSIAYEIRYIPKYAKESHAHKHLNKNNDCKYFKPKLGIIGALKTLVILKIFNKSTQRVRARNKL